MVPKEVFEMKNLLSCKTMRDIKSLKSDLKSELIYFRLSISNIESLKEYIQLFFNNLLKLKVVREHNLFTSKF